MTESGSQPVGHRGCFAAVVDVLPGATLDALDLNPCVVDARDQLPAADFVRACTRSRCRVPPGIAGDSAGVAVAGLTRDDGFGIADTRERGRHRGGEPDIHGAAGGGTAPKLRALTSGDFEWACCAS